MHEPMFSGQEQLARYKLHTFITQIGKVVTADKATTEGITSETLLDAFTRVHPNEAKYLTPASVNHFLLAGGYVSYDEVQTRMYLKIFLKDFEQLPRDTQLAIIDWIPRNVSLNYRKVLLGYGVSGDIPDRILISNFIRDYCMHVNNYYAVTHLVFTNYRLSTRELYDYFKDVCITCSIENIPPKGTFFDILQHELEYTCIQCCVRGKSGTRSFNTLLAPILEQDRRDSLRYGIAVFTAADGKRITSKGLFELHTEIELEHLHATRKERLTGGAIEETEEIRSTEMEHSSNRAEDGKDASIKIQQQESFIKEQPEISRTEENDLPDVIGSNQQLQEPKATINADGRTSDENKNPIAAATIPSDSEAGVEYTDGFDDNESDEDIEHENTEYDDIQVSGYEEFREDIKSGNRDAKESIEDDEADPMAGKEYLLNGAPEDYDEETGLPLTEEQKKAKLPLMQFENILYVCKVHPLYQDPTQLTLEALTELMSKMHTELKAVDIYPRLLQALQK